MNKSQIEFMEKMFEIPTTYVDKTHCICLGPNARITFVETAPEADTPTPRVSVTMTLQNLFEMIAMLNNIKTQLEEKAKAEIPPPKPDEKPDEVLH